MDSIFPDTPQKQCSRCEEWYPDTSKYFRRHKDGSLQGVCNKHFKENREQSKLVPDGYKRCPRCKDIHPLTEEYFLPNHKKPGKFYPPCRSCSKKGRTKSYWDHREQELQINHDYCQRTFEERRQKRVANYQANIEEKRTNARNYQKAHRDQRCVTERNRNARKKAIPGTHTPEQIQDQLKRQKYRCYYAACGFSKFPRVKENGKWKYLYHVDHTFPISRIAGTDIPGNDMGYLVLACEFCNGSKHDKFPWEWYEGGRLL